MKLSLIILLGIVFLYLPNHSFSQATITVTDGTTGILGISTKDDTVFITRVIPGSPADKANLKYRDQIFRINDFLVSGNGTSTRQVKQLLMGSALDSVSLLVKRPQDEANDTLFLPYDLHLQQVDYFNIEYLVDSLEQMDLEAVISDTSKLLFSNPIVTQCLVRSVEKESLAARKGLLPGDQIISLADELENEGSNAFSFSSLRDRTRDTSITVLRDGETILIGLNPSEKDAMEGVMNQYEFDYTQKCIWVRINVENRLSSDRTYIFNFPTLGESGSVKFFEKLPDSRVIESKAGMQLLTTDRDYIYKNWCAVRVHLTKGTARTFYAKIETEEFDDPPSITIIAQETIINHDRIERMVLSAFYGMLLIICLYYLILFVATRKMHFLYFSLFVMSFGLLAFTTEGFLGEYTWNNLALFKVIDYANRELMLSFVSIFFLLLGVSYLDLKRTMIWWYRSAMIIIGLTLFSTVVFTVSDLFPDQDFGIFRGVVVGIYVFAGIFFPLFLLIMPAIMRIRQGFKPGWYFLIANILLVVCLILSFQNFGFKFNLMNLYRSTLLTFFLISAMYLAAVLQFMLFSVGLAQKIKLDEKEHKLAQMRIIDQLKENEGLKDKVNRELEQKVVERTSEIREQKEEIESQRDEIEAQRDLLQVQKDIVVNQKQELTDSINYAERIQSAVLPQKEYMDTLMHEYFVLFKPRDIVSGDFYWIKKVGNYLIVIAADCTGHGVPGAFMSMLGIALLNEQLSKDRADAPGEILNGLRNKVKEILAQTGKAYEQQDGMEMALAMIDIDQHELHYAGAYNPLYIIRQKNEPLEDQLGQYLNLETESHQLFELKGDRQPIAIYTTESEFNTKKVRLLKGDTLYLFSDGFVDQKGGPNQKKFLSKNFKKLLIGIQSLSLEDQKMHLENVLTTWQKDIEQVDDILVMGIRV